MIFGRSPTAEKIKVTNKGRYPQAVGLASMAWWQSPVLHLQVLLAVAFMVGGGGVGAGLANLLVQLAALACLAANGPRVWQFISSGPRPLVILLALTIGLPLVQLVPLPPALWQTLPGRELVREAHAVAGLGDIWFPASLDRGRTLVALFGTLAPGAIIAIGMTLDRAGMLKLAQTALALVMISLIAGIIQLSSGNTAGMIQGDAHVQSVLYGQFANRNSTGLMFVCSIPLLAGLALATRRTDRAIVATVLGSLLALGTFLTQSRSSMVILAIVLIVLVPYLLRVFLARRPEADRTARRSWGWISLGMGLLMAAAASLSFVAGGRVAQSIERFQLLDSDRPEMWEDGIYAARQYWPIGSGTGTFDEVFQVHESLEYISPRTAGRAHNDFIELAIESGLGGLALMVGWLAWCGHAALRTGPPEERRLRLMAGLAAVCFPIQSVLDYPLRSQTTLALAGVIIVLLATGGKRSQS